MMVHLLSWRLRGAHLFGQWLIDIVIHADLVYGLLLIGSKSGFN
jgi:hypothetical protein